MPHQHSMSHQHTISTIEPNRQVYAKTLEF
jgi:sRNA-binding regulator protein Hfq